MGLIHSTKAPSLSQAYCVVPRIADIAVVEGIIARVVRRPPLSISSPTFVELSVCWVHKCFTKTLAGPHHPLNARVVRRPSLDCYMTALLNRGRVHLRLGAWSDAPLSILI